MTNNKRKYNLNSNSMSISLKKPTIMINAKDIKDTTPSNIENDEIFTKKYLQFLNGKKNVYITRLSLSKIKKGFYKRDKESKKWKYILDNINHEYIKMIKKEIRTGDRPVLHIYENPNNKCSFPFVCPDDVNLHKAYKDLGISKVPVILIGTKKGIEESTFIQKMFPDVKDNKYLIYSTVPFRNKNYQSLLGNDLTLDAIEGLYKLEKHFIQIKEELQEFHLEGMNEIHYHEMMYSIILRITEMLKSIRLLLSEGLTFQACMLLRSLYELSLNFYITWLSPYDMAQILQTNSVFTRTEFEKISKHIFDEQLEEGLDKVFANDIKEVRLYQYDFTNKIINKARLSPLGEYIYREIYSFLSDITHHDFSMVARYKNALEHGDEVIYDKDILTSILRMTDAIVSVVYTRMKDDIGNNLE
jgi:hypothetical protein